MISMTLIKPLMAPCLPIVASNHTIQQMYINGHFCYTYKFGIVTNGLGIVRDITFYNRDFLAAILILSF